MTKTQKKRSIFARLRNNFIAGIVVLIPIGVTIYLTLFIIKISSIILPKELNPNHYLPYEIPGVEIVISVILIFCCIYCSFLALFPLVLSHW